MWPFKKKEAPEPAPKPEPETITFSAKDQPMERAQKIWKALGFVNDRFNAVPSIAGYLAMYRDWDRLNAQQDNPTDTTGAKG